MVLPVESLPSDIEELRAFAIKAVAERDTLSAQNDILSSQNDRLRHLLKQLQRMQFGRKSAASKPLSPASVTAFGLSARGSIISSAASLSA